MAVLYVFFALHSSGSEKLERVANKVFVPVDSVVRVEAHLESVQTASASLLAKVESLTLDITGITEHLKPDALEVTVQVLSDLGWSLGVVSKDDVLTTWYTQAPLGMPEEGTHVASSGLLSGPADSVQGALDVVRVTGAPISFGFLSREGSDCVEMRAYSMGDGNVLLGLRSQGVACASGREPIQSRQVDRTESQPCTPTEEDTWNGG